MNDPMDSDSDDSFIEDLGVVQEALPNQDNDDGDDDDDDVVVIENQIPSASEVRSYQAHEAFRQRFGLTRLNNLDNDFTRVDSASNGNCAMITQINGLYDDGYYPSVPFLLTDPPSSSIMTPEQQAVSDARLLRDYRRRREADRQVKLFDINNHRRVLADHYCENFRRFRADPTLGDPVGETPLILQNGQALPALSGRTARLMSSVFGSIWSPEVDFTHGAPRRYWTQDCVWSISSHKFQHLDCVS